jgi:trehalose 6-phosphate phosphatase
MPIMQFAWPQDIDNWALFLDIDGTLVPIAPDPWSVKPSPILPDLLKSAAARLKNALAIVSGRELYSIENVTSSAIHYLAGGHGAEFRFGEHQPVQEAVHPEVGGLQIDLRPLVERHPALLLEVKRAGIAVHYRQAPYLADEVRRTMEAVLASEARRGLGLLQGDLVLEIRSPSHNKGTAVRRLMQEPPFHKRRPIFIGDDISDEEAFAVVQEMGGTAVIVGDRRPTLATHELSSPTDVLRVLAEL